MTDKPNEYLSAMIEILNERGRGAMFTRAAEYAAEYNRKLNEDLINSLYELTKSSKGTKKALEILEPIVHTKEIDKESPYAWLYEKFDEPKLLKHYKEHKGNLELLKRVKSKDGATAPQIAVLAAVVPYLDLAENSSRILPESDKAAQLLEHKSLMDFIMQFANLEKDTKGLYLYCRYANEQKIQDLLSSRRKEAGRNNRKYFEKYLPKRALLLSDTKAAIIELQKAEKYDWRSPLEEYARMRGTTKDAVLDKVLTDIGLDDNGIKVYDLGGFKVTAALTPELKLSLFNEATGKYLKSIPKKGADLTKYEAAKVDFAEKRKALKNIVKARFNRLLENFLSARKQNAEEWKNANLDNAINRQIAELLIWDQNGKTFTIKEKKLIDSAGKEVILTEKPIKLAHPMEMKENDISAWQKYFADNNLKQPFLQVWEPVVNPETVKKDRYKDIKLPLVYFMSLDKHGIIYNSSWSYDEGRDININFKDCSLGYEIEAKYLGEFSKDDKIKFGDFTFYNYNRQVNHIVSLLDKWTFYERIKKDDMSVIDRMDSATAAQLAD